MDEAASSGLILTLASQASGESDHQINRLVVQFSQRMESIRWHRSTSGGRTTPTNIVQSALAALGLGLATLLSPAPAHADEPTPHEVTGTIAGSLASSLKRQKVPPEVVDTAVRAFAFDPDFPKKLPKDAAYKLVYETKPATADKKARAVLHSVWVKEGSTIHDVYRYGWRGDTPVFMNQHGRSIRELVLMAPVEDARLSSSFGWRDHPILKERKFHFGLDLVAPPGSIVRAAADGVVVFVGWQGNYGQYIRLQHGQRIATGYAHLSSFVTTLKKGMIVHQGDMIGFVGMTGLATGPHLCFQVLEDGKLLDPRSARPMVEEDFLAQVTTNRGIYPVERLTDIEP